MNYFNLCKGLYLNGVKPEKIITLFSRGSYLAKIVRAMGIEHPAILETIMANLRYRESNRYRHLKMRFKHFDENMHLYIKKGAGK